MNLEAFPKPAAQLMLSYCSLGDEFSLSRVSRKLRRLVHQTSAHAKLFPVMTALCREFTPRARSKDRVDAANWWTRRVQVIPLIGTVFAVGRLVVFSGIAAGSGVCLAINRRKARGTADPFERELLQIRATRQSSGARQALREVFLSTLGIPFIPLFVLNEVVKSEIEVYDHQRWAIRLLKSSINRLRWLDLVEDHLLPFVAPRRGNLPLLHRMHQIMQACRAVRIQGRTPQQELPLWDQRKNIFHDYYGEVVEQVHRVQKLSALAKELIARIIRGSPDCQPLRLEAEEEFERPF